MAKCLIGNSVILISVLTIVQPLCVIKEPMPKRNIKPGDDVDFELYDLDTAEFVCSQYIKDDYIKNFIQKNGNKGKCDYCDKNLNVIELYKVLELIITGIDYLYEDPANSRYLNKEGLHGFDGNTFYFYDLKVENTNLFEDIYKYLKMIVCIAI